ncbi:MAG: gas vesicle protein GvpO [bacterium]
MKPKELIDNAKKQLVELTGFKSPAGIGLRREKANWIAVIEIVEKKSIPDGMDVLGTYEILLDVKGDLLKYERIDLRKRTDTALVKEE